MDSIPEDLIKREETHRLRDDRPVVVVHAPKPSFAGRFGMGMLTTATFHFLMNPFGLWSVIPYACAASLFWFGWGAKPPEQPGDKHKSIIERVEDASKKVIKRVESHPDVNVVDAGVKGATITSNLADRLNPINAITKNVTAPIKELGNDVKKGAVLLGGQLQNGVDDLAAKAKLLKEHHDKEERERLMAEADSLGLTYDKEWSNAKLCKIVQDAQQAKRDAEEAAERAAWEKRYNGQCPMPNCRQPMKVSLRGHGRYMCSHCKTNVGADEVRRMGPPPMPRKIRGFFR